MATVVVVAGVRSVGFAPTERGRCARETSAVATVLPFDRQCRIIASLVDGVSVRATERLCEVQKKTVSKLALAVGEGCIGLHSDLFRGLRSLFLEFDEIHSWVHTKQGHLKSTDPDEYG